MAFLAALPEVLAVAGEAGAAGGAAGGVAAAGGAEGAAAGGAAAGGGGGGMSAIGKIFKSPVMPIPHMGSNGGSKSPGLAQANSYLNSDQFR